MKKLAAFLCNILGTLILLAVIGSCLLLTVPRFVGWQVYNVVSGSMEPEIPIGSLIYVEPVEPGVVVEEDIIAFQSGDSVVTHRVVRNHQLEGAFTTKGDANEQEDVEPVPYEALIGRVEKHIPYLGEFLVIYTTNVGKVYVICFAACGAMLNVLAGRLRDRAKETDVDDIIGKVSKV